ncbi:Crp/Fnr family transcriptional regulator [Nonomuraea africana]|uniref:CRP-like cAMP-binding protein n=1 Tax=Nonomuraea africana TaxID=46171 RepID=A0ABR9KDA7_9ACTN|nr:Crp/Fnr family transcriptional regulator [Nonomuraea africana]MBE1559796.1 CRP-like cAMP-binding protein [Nonomuraea africana]
MSTRPAEERAPVPVTSARRKLALEAQGFRHNSFWVGLGKAGRKALLSVGRWKRYAGPHDAIYRRGQNSDFAFVLLDGHVKAVLNADTRHPTMLALRYPGQILGEDEALEVSGTPVRAMTMQPLHRVEGILITRDRFQGFLNQHPTAWPALSRELLTRLNEAEERLGQQASEAANSRLAKALVSLIDYPMAVRLGSSRMAVPLTQAELASWIGASRETVERILRDWRDRDIVATAYRSIVVLRPNDLIRISGLLRHWSVPLNHPSAAPHFVQARARVARRLYPSAIGSRPRPQPVSPIR